MPTEHDNNSPEMMCASIDNVLKRDLESYQRILQDMEAGRRKVGISTDGISWKDTTDQESARLRAPIAELTEFVSKTA